MKRRHLLLSVVALSSAALASARLDPATVAEPQEPVTVILVRHAEKAADDPRDPSLSDAGLARAEALARLLQAAGVTHLYASEFTRTQATLAPLAEHTGLDVETISARTPEPQLDALRGLEPGSVAVVAGHSNTVPALVHALGGTVDELEDTQYGAILREDAYDRLFVLTLPVDESAAPKTVELRYGADGS